MKSGLSYKFEWWAGPDSDRRPSARQADVLTRLDDRPTLFAQFSMAPSYICASFCRHALCLLISYFTCASSILQTQLSQYGLQFRRRIAVQSIVKWGNELLLSRLSRNLRGFYSFQNGIRYELLLIPFKANPHSIRTLRRLCKDRTPEITLKTRRTRI
jgi:hypothetical protein